MSKYNNAIINTPDGKFHSKAEYKRWLELKWLEEVGEIESLARQFKFDIVLNGVKICRYISDFYYIDLDPKHGARGQETIEDVKGVETDVFQLKWKLCQAIYPDYVWRIVKA